MLLIHTWGTQIFRSWKSLKGKYSEAFIKINSNKTIIRMQFGKLLEEVRRTSTTVRNDSIVSLNLEAIQDYAFLAGISNESQVQGTCLEYCPHYTEPLRTFLPIWFDLQAPKNKNTSFVRLCSLKTTILSVRTIMSKETSRKTLSCQSTRWWLAVMH